MVVRNQIVDMVRRTLMGDELILSLHLLPAFNCSPLLSVFGLLAGSYDQCFESNSVLHVKVPLLKVKVHLYGCDCYAYALLASGFVDLVIESGLKKVLEA